MALPREASKKHNHAGVINLLNVSEAYVIQIPVRRRSSEVEQLTRNEQVAGSSPIVGLSFFNRLLNLVCLLAVTIHEAFLGGFRVRAAPFFNRLFKCINGAVFSYHLYK